jgi:tetratricopeptide (TPR) repeat protein
MPALTFYSSPRTDRSSTIGLAAVILFAVVEASTLGLHYFGTISANRVAAKPAVSTPAPVAAPRATVAPPPPVAQASATPAAALTPSTSTLSAADRLLKEATALRERGDTTTALSRLQEASEKDPKNAQVLAEMATIYESIQNFDRSNETWRRVQEIGPSAGPLYELADAKLTKGATAIPPTGPAAAESSPSTAGAAAPAVKGIPQGSTLGISEVTATDQADPDSETNLNLRIGVKKRPNTVIDHTKVKIQVYFYDGLPNGDVKLTDADVSYEWITPNHDWTDTDTEILAVTYVRAKNKSLSSEAALAAAAAAVNPAKKGKVVKPSPPPPDIAQRKYLGYIVRVYYNDQLQDKRAEPTKLLNLFPPPFNASSP